MTGAACRSAPEAAEMEIQALVGDLLEAVRAGDPARLSAFFLHDPRYERGSPGTPSGAQSERVRLADFCSTQGFEYNPPSPQVALLRHRAVVTFDLSYRFDREGKKVERVARVTLFVERRPQGWGILRDSVAFPAEGE
jgi:ketosteroid isomerase-like protein